jgi:hypothetical protein
MSYFVCLALPQKALGQLASAFDRSVHITDVTETPFGKATYGENREWVAYILQVGSSSASLINRGVEKKSSSKTNRPELFVSGIRTLLEDGSCSSVTFLMHLMFGLIKTEKICVQEQKVIKLADLAQSMLFLQEDIRYLVTR